MKIAMVGSYAHVGNVLNGVLGLEDVRIVAATPYGPADKLGFIGRHQAAPANLPVYDDYRKMIDETKPDLVSVYVPMYQIAEVSTAAAERGCHVIAEKPLAITLADLETLRGAVEKNNVQIIASLGMRGAPAFQAVRQAVECGRIGEPVHAFGQKSYPFGARGEIYKKRETYGGSIPWQAIHALDFVAYCVGKDYKRVAAMHANVAHGEYGGTEDTGGILLEFAGGGHAVISFDYFRPFTRGTGRNWGGDRLRVVGTEAEVEVLDDGNRVVLMTPTSKEDVPLPPGRDVVAEFIELLRGRREDCLLSCAESLRMTEVALKAREAADTGTVIDLP